MSHICKVPYVRSVVPTGGCQWVGRHLLLGCNFVVNLLISGRSALKDVATHLLLLCLQWPEWWKGVVSLYAAEVSRHVKCLQSLCEPDPTLHEE